MTPENYLLMTGQDLPRVKIYPDWGSPVTQYICTAKHWAALTDSVRKVKKVLLNASWDVDEVRETDNYNNSAASLVVVQALTYR